MIAIKLAQYRRCGGLVFLAEMVFNGVIVHVADVLSVQIVPSCRILKAGGHPVSFMLAGNDNPIVPDAVTVRRPAAQIELGDIVIVMR